jgi:hypothetical protein
MGRLHLGAPPESPSPAMTVDVDGVGSRFPAGFFFFFAFFAFFFFFQASGGNASNGFAEDHMSCHGVLRACSVMDSRLKGKLEVGR